MSDHPLDPLSAEEFRAVAQILRREKDVARPHWRIASVELREPTKDVVRAFQPGDPIAREARVVAWNTEDGTAYVGVLSLTDDALLSWDAQPGKQPNATVDEWHDCDAAMRRHPDVLAALATRGITDPDLVLVDVWTYGAHLIPSAYEGRRIGWCDVWLRDSPDSNPYAHPVSGLKLVVDLNTMELLEIEDTPSAGFPDVQGEYVPKHVPGLQQRTDLKPLDIRQPDGVSFTLDGNELSWQGWRHAAGFRLPRGRDPAPGLLRGGRSIVAPHLVRRDGGALPRPDARPLAPHRLRHRRVGPRLHDDLARARLRLPRRDPLPRRRAARLAGEPQTVNNAICIHEEDNAVLWKHVDERAGAEVRRMRRLVVSFHVTVANYEYLVYWRFYQDGNIECEVRATGIMVTTPFERDDAPPYGTVVDTQTYAPIHQHFLTVRLDMEVDGPDNTVVMSETEQLPIGPDNPYGLALAQRSVPLARRAASTSTGPPSAPGRSPTPNVRNGSAPRWPTSSSRAPRCRRCSTRARPCCAAPGCWSTRCGSPRTPARSAGRAASS